MSRIKSIDAFRGFSIFIMIFYHPILWWTLASQVWMLLLVRRLLFLEASLFLFVSGISVVLSLRSRMEKINLSPFYSKSDLFKEHYLRSLMFLLLAIIYNLIINIWTAGLGGIWSWHILFTVAVCLLIAYPLIKLSTMTRVLFTFFIIFVTYPLFYLLESLKLNFPNEGWSVLYHLIFNPIQEYPILPNLAFFTLGTVCGDVFYKIYKIDNENLKIVHIKNTIVKRFFFFGISLMVGSLIFSLIIFKDIFIYLNRNTPICMLFGVGWALFLIALFTYLHEFKFTPNWKYRFFFYFSFYSLTLYLVHNIVALFFWESLNIVISVALSIVSIIGFWYLSKLMYNKFGPKFSIKYLLSKGTRKKSN